MGSGEEEEDWVALAKNIFTEVVVENKEEGSRWGTRSPARQVG